MPSKHKIVHHPSGEQGWLACSVNHESSLSGRMGSCWGREHAGGPQAGGKIQRVKHTNETVVAGKRDMARAARVLLGGQRVEAQMVLGMGPSGRIKINGTGRGEVHVSVQQTRHEALACRGICGLGCAEWRMCNNRAKQGPDGIDCVCKQDTHGSTAINRLDGPRKGRGYKEREAGRDGVRWTSAVFSKRRMPHGARRVSEGREGKAGEETVCPEGAGGTGRAWGMAGGRESTGLSKDSRGESTGGQQGYVSRQRVRWTGCKCKGRRYGKEGCGGRGGGLLLDGSICTGAKFFALPF